MTRSVSRMFAAAASGSTRRIAAGVAAGLIAATSGSAFPAALDAQALPDARAVLARYATATNAAKLIASPGHSMSGTFSMGAFGGPMRSYSDSIGRSVQVVTIAGMGDVKEGVDTAFAWSLDPSQGPKLITGKEFAEMRERGDPRAMRRDPALVTGAQTLARDSVGGESCISVKLTWKSGRTTTDCYSERTGYLVSSAGTQVSSMGNIEYTTTYSDYKTFDGVTLPTKSVQRAFGTEATVVITTVTFGAVDPAHLALPPEIQALRKK